MLYLSQIKTGISIGFMQPTIAKISLIERLVNLKSESTSDLYAVSERCSPSRFIVLPIVLNTSGSNLVNPIASTGQSHNTHRPILSVPSTVFVSPFDCFCQSLRPVLSVPLTLFVSHLKIVGLVIQSMRHRIVMCTIG